MVLSPLLLLAVLCCSALGQLGQVNMRQVTESLGQRFEEIKRYGLGVEALQVTGHMYIQSAVIVEYIVLC